MASGTTGRVQVLEEVYLENPSGWRLCFQWCRFVYQDGTLEEGYRFIWRRSDGSLQPARGQARLPSITIAEQLLDMAKRDGWGHHIGPDANLKQ